MLIKICWTHDFSVKQKKAKEQSQLFVESVVDKVDEKYVLASFQLLFSKENSKSKMNNK